MLRELPTVSLHLRDQAFHQFPLRTLPSFSNVYRWLKPVKLVVTGKEADQFAFICTRPVIE